MRRPSPPFTKLFHNFFFFTIDGFPKSFRSLYIITATVNLLSVITMMMDGVRSLKVILSLEVVLGNEGHSCAD